MTNTQFEVVARCSRAGAFEEGYLVNVTEITPKPGLKIPVALTAAELKRNRQAQSISVQNSNLNYQRRIKILTKSKNRSWLECFSLLPENSGQKIYEYIRYAGASGYQDKYLRRASRNYLHQITHLWDLCGINAAIERIDRNYNFFLSVHELKFDK